MSNLVEFAKSELAQLGGEDDNMQKAINKHIIAMVQLFADEGHSGSTAAYTISILEKLLAFKPITPLTGKDEEWFECTDGLKQNKRCPSVFKDADGTCYDIDAKALRQPDGFTYMSHDREPISFPYTPSQTVVDIDHCVGCEKWPCECDNA